MSELRFGNLKIHNFLTVGDVELSLDNRGLIGIQGVNESDSSSISNGAGKSSLVDALSWVLYGVTAKGVEGDRVINRTAKKDCFVSVEIFDGAESYIATRYRKHKTGKNRLTLFKADGTDLTLGTDKLTQDLLMKILGCPHDVFVASIYSGQEQMPDLPKKTDKELKMLVEEAAGVSVLQGAYDIARERASMAERAFEMAKSSEGGMVNRLVAARSELEGLIEHRNKWDADRDERVRQLTEQLTKMVEAAKIQSATVKAIDFAALEKAVEDAQAALASAAKPPPAPTPPTPQALPPRPAPLRRDLLPLQNAIFQREGFVAGAERTIKALDDEIGRFTHELKHLNAKVGTPCGECGKHYAAQDLDGRKDVIRDRVAAIRNERVDADRDLHAAQHSVQLAKEAMNAAILQYDNQDNDAIGEWSAQCSLVEQYNRDAQAAHQRAVEAHASMCASLDTSQLIAALTRTQNDLAASQKLRDALTNEVTRCKGARDGIEAVKNETNPYTKLVGAKHADIAKQEVEVDAKHAEAERLCELAQNARHAADVFGPKGMRGELLDVVTPALNERTAHYLNILSDGNVTATWQTIGATTKGEARESFHIAVDNREGGEGFNEQSGGEKRKVRLATALALQDLVASRAYKPIRLFIGDELDDALDEAGLERLMQVLNDKATSAGTVLVISHNEISDWCRNTITIRKKDGKSELVGA